MNEVDAARFSPDYIETADDIFLRPQPTYTWDEIVAGTQVQTKSGGLRQVAAVEQNTFRGFHRINRDCSGAKEAFVGYFLEHRVELVDKLSSCRDREDLNRLSESVCSSIRSRLDNCRPSQLAAYNKIRKPVDLYIEHLVAMATELNEVRADLVPLLFLPLDSQILAYRGLFMDEELSHQSLSRKSTYKDIIRSSSYETLQSLLVEKAATVSATHRRPFHVIYFDLLWNDRDRNGGGNLFETNP